jgi:malate dehydrogenase (oxaloacetate-decarboxylating)
VPKELLPPFQSSKKIEKKQKIISITNIMNKNLKISLGGKLEATSRIKVTKDNISNIYTPGVADVVREGMKSERNVNKYTWRGNLVAVISDGSAILGLGNQGPGPALPVMEAKSVLFKELGGVDAIPIVLNTQDMETIISTIKNI